MPCPAISCHVEEKNVETCTEFAVDDAVRYLISLSLSMTVDVPKRVGNEASGARVRSIVYWIVSDVIGLASCVSIHQVHSCKGWLCEDWSSVVDVLTS